MQLTPWTHTAREGFTLRGWHTAPSGKPLIHFLHGNGFCGRTYEPMLQYLARDFDLWLCDIQGHGDSDHGGRFVGWNRNAELAIEAFKAHGQPLFGQVPHFGLGHSLGGVLTGLAMGEQRKLFQRTVLLDPVLFSPAMIGLMALSDVVGLYSRNQLAQRARRRRHHWPDRGAAHANLHGRGMFRGWREDAFQAYVEHALRDVPGGGVELKCRPTREAEIFGSYPRRLWASLTRIAQPTLVLRGADSFPFAARAIDRWTALRPGVECRVLPGGHCFMQEDPDASAAAIRAFLLG